MSTTTAVISPKYIYLDIHMGVESESESWANGKQIPYV